MPDPIQAELAALALAKIEAKDQATDASAPPVYGAGLSGVFDKLNLQSAFVSILIDQVIGKAKDFAIENRDEMAQWVADKAEDLTKLVIDKAVEFADSLGA